MTLIFYAPLIAGWFYRDEVDATESFSVDCDDLFRIGAQLLGIYALLKAVEPMGDSFFSRVMSMTYLTSSREMGTIDFLRVGLYVVLGTFLIFGSKRIVIILGRIRYIPERDAYEPPPIEDATEASVDKSSQ